ncbi:ATP-binding protein [Opitutus sp. ER46]|uniref:ATP-binding protein n=1 Tax=Opitutus sp. ER46 TaxID=2161864 RepID=UPI000D301F33|nr:ATP-binding protein [Opitutus sp. ER46]PTX91184.1 hypothetical protein DB354_21370 [Opitutus sp. ER46]
MSAWGETVSVGADRATAMLGWMQEIAPYGILTTDRELRIQSWNEWLVQHSGREAGEVLDRPLFEVFPDLPQRRLDEHYRRALQGEVSVLASALHRYLLPLAAPVRGTGFSHMQQTARIAPLLSGGILLGTITVIEDVTQREVHAALLRRQHDHERLLSSTLAHLLQSRDPLREVAEIYPKVAAALDLELCCSYMLDPDQGTLRLHTNGGGPLENRWLPHSLSLADGLCGRCATQRQPVLLAQLQESDDPGAARLREYGLRAVAVFPLLVGERLLGTVAFGTRARDRISPTDVEFLSTLAQYVAVALERGLRDQALCTAQEALSRHAETLEGKVVERTAALHETIAQLESFSYTVAHDLRAPIRALIGYSDILLTDFGAQLPDTGRGMLQRVHASSLRLDQLTRDLLRFSRVSRDKLEITPQNLDDLVPEVIASTAGLQPGMLTLETPLGAVWAQRTLLQQCLANLIDNALKFGAPGRPLHLVIRSEILTGDDDTTTRQAAFADASFGAINAEPRPWLRVYVIDNGIGIPRDAHHRIFGIFERLPTGRATEGTGIGLAIVERAVQRMGGRCGVDSEVGVGSRFWIELAAAPVSPTASR